MIARFVLLVPTTFFCLALLFPSVPRAQTRFVPETKPQIQFSFAPLVQKTASSVVNVYGTRIEKRPQNASMDDFFRRFFGEGAPGQGRERVQRSLGSGVIVDTSGLVVTNHHVIEGMTEVKVALADRREFEADIVLRDPRTDLAVLRLKGAQGFQPMELGDSEALQVGDIVLAIGNPFGVGQTVTQGIVSALARTQVGISDYQFFIQTDAAINPGNSGGALINMNGNLIGINTAIFSQSGGSHGIGFAIPSSMVKAVVESAKGGSRIVRRPWLGAKMQVVAPEMAESLGLDRPMGALIAGVTEKSPAEAAGLKRGDVVTAVEGQDIDDPESFGYRFALKGLNGQTHFTIWRGGKKQVVAVNLGPPPETRPRDSIRLSGRSPFSGATALNLSPAVADELQMDIADEGVVLSEFESGSTAQQVGFQRGDIIVAVNGQKIASSRDLEAVSRKSFRAWEIAINRGGQVMTTILGG